MPIDIKLEGIEDIRRLSAALEQYNAKAGACAADYKATAEEAARAVCILRGEPVAPRLPSQPISVLESAAQEASEAVYNQKSAIRVLGGALYVGGVEWVQDVARLVRDTSTAIRHLREETTPADGFALQVRCPQGLNDAWMVLCAGQSLPYRYSIYSFLQVCYQRIQNCLNH